MISLERFCLMIGKERARMSRVELKTDFVLGVMAGLLLSVTMAKDLYTQTRHQRVPNPDGFHRRKVA